MTARLFVGNLNPRTTEEELRSFFSPVGASVALSIPIDRKTRRPRGFAFVAFATAGDAERALAILSGRSLGGRKLHLDWARERQRPTARGREHVGPGWRPPPSVEAFEDKEQQERIPRSEEDYARKRRSRPLRHGKHGSDRVRSRGTRRSIR
jgi:RNA recognition motif-containing protein